MIYSYSLAMHYGQKNVFLAKKFLILVSNRFAMLHIFYKQLRLQDSTESCLFMTLSKFPS